MILQSAAMFLNLRCRSEEETGAAEEQPVSNMICWME